MSKSTILSTGQITAADDIVTVQPRRAVGCPFNDHDPLALPAIRHHPGPAASDRQRHHVAHGGGNRQAEPDSGGGTMNRPNMWIMLGLAIFWAVVINSLVAVEWLTP